MKYTGQDEKSFRNQYRDQAEKSVSGVAHGLDLLDGVVAEGVAAKGDDNTIGLAKRLRHCWNPFCKRPTTH